MAAGATFTAGVGMTMTVIFAGSGVVLIAVGAALLLLGLLVRLLTPLEGTLSRRREGVPTQRQAKAGAA